MPETEEVRKMYLKSHKDYDPGEQKVRPYDWPVDPTDFRFGKVEKNPVYNEIKQIMSAEAHSEAMPQTVFVKSHLHDYLDKKDDKLGKGMNLGQKQFPPDRVFGVRVQGNDWDAGKCLKGEANEYEVRPDDNLGKTNKYGFRNITKEGDENRVFGVPTIRYDIPKPIQQSVADPNVLPLPLRTTQTRQLQSSCCSRSNFPASE
jgi:EF-hand domain-containing family member B